MHSLAIKADNLQRNIEMSDFVLLSFTVHCYIGIQL